MNIEQALTEEILAHPDDDLPRLAMADWFEEQGRQERAELIRVQIELARMAEDDERRRELLSRQLWLLTRHSKEWGHPVRGLARRWEFRRGFVEDVTLQASELTARAGDLFARAPLRHLHLVYPRANPHLADCPQLARVRELTLTENQFAVVPHSLLFSPRVQQLQSLRLFAGWTHPEELRAIAALPSLEKLELRNCRCAPRFALDRLEAAGSLPRLRYLSLVGWTGPVAWNSVLDRLEGLELRNPPPRRARDILQRLVSRKRTIPLRTLAIANVPSGFDLQNLLASDALEDLHRLQFRGCAIGARDVAALVGARGPKRLVHLDLGFNPLGQNGMESLVHSPCVTHLVSLGVARRIRVAWSISCLLRPLCAAPPRRLGELDLSGNALTAEDCLDLSCSSLEQQLYRLDLRDTQLDYKGVEALLAGDWPRLAWLDVRANDLSDSTKAALRTRFGYTVHY